MRDVAFTPRPGSGRGCDTATDLSARHRPAIL